MDSIVHRSLLYDFYSVLLTEKQRSFYELYYLEDLSLNEIAEQYGVSAPAVSDLLKRTTKILEDYEAKLNLIQKFYEQTAVLTKIRSLLTELKRNEQLPAAIEKLEEMETELENL